MDIPGLISTCVQHHR